MIQETESVLTTLASNVGAAFIMSKTPLGTITNDNNIVLHYVKKGAMIYFVSMGIDMALGNTDMSHNPIDMADASLGNAVILYTLDAVQFSDIVQNVNPIQGEMGVYLTTGATLTALQLISDKLDNSPLHLVKNIASYLKLKLNL